MSGVTKADESEVNQSSSNKYKCDICQQRFKYASNLARHLRTAHKTDSFRCEQCKKTFSRRDILNRHKKSHSKTEEFSCDICSKGFQRKDNFLQHVKECSKKKRQREDEDETPVAKRSREEHEDWTEQNPVSLEDIEDDVEAEMKKHWKSIETYFKCHKVLDVYNFRLIKQELNVGEELEKTWDKNINCHSKLNCAVAYLLRHKKTGEVRYYHSSFNNTKLFGKPMIIKNSKDLQRFRTRLENTDILEFARKERPNTEWVVILCSNLTFYFFKMPLFPRIGCGRIALPDYLLGNKNILAMESDIHNGRHYKDKLCFFRCLAIKIDCQCSKKCRCSRPLERTTLKLFTRFKSYMGATWMRKEFQGVTLSDLITIEKLFRVSIIVFEINPQKECLMVWNSKSVYDKKLYLNLYKDHFSYIKDVNAYAQVYECGGCERVFSRLHELKRHNCSKKEKTFAFPKQCFGAPPSIFDILESELDVRVAADRKIYPFRITYDIECYTPRDNLPDNTDKMNFSARHEILSVSVCSNVPGYESPECLIRSSSADELIERFVNLLCTISKRAYDILFRRFHDVLQEIDFRVSQREESERDFKEDNFSNAGAYAARYPGKFKEKFLAWLHQVPTIGFNSQRYDINVMKGPLMKHLYNSGQIKFTIKRHKNMQCIETDKLRFFDIRNYIAPGFNYDKYLRAFDCLQQKGFFPYEYLDSLSKLSETSLPQHSAFYSSLKSKNITKEEYEYCHRIWKENDMKSMRDFLKWYNNLDVAPFQEAIKKQSAIYSQRGIDMFKQAMSLPGLAVLWLFTEVNRDKFDITMIDECNKDLYQIIKSNLVGGPSIVFHRYHEKGITKIRENEFGSEKAKVCHNIMGFDANALYLWSMMQNMPTGSMVRRYESDGFKPRMTQKFGRMACGWMEYVMKEKGIYIEHMFNKGEKRIGQHGLPVDGFDPKTKTVYQFHGCYFHGHDCRITAGEKKNNVNGETMNKLNASTSRKDEYIRKLGYNLEIMRECEWLNFLSRNHEAKEFVLSFLKRENIYDDGMSMQEITNKILDGSLFGLIECDLMVPVHLRDKFQEMSPIFKNVMVGRQELSEHMLKFAETTEHLKQPQRMLIGSMKGEKILLLSDLLRWYLQKGLIVTRIYQVVQYKPVACFKRFGESVCEARREGDVDASKTLLADTCKLIGNSVYGKTITNKENHRNVKYVNGDRSASNKVKLDSFINLEEIDPNFYEIMMEKKRIVLDIPIAIGFGILQNAKLRMVQFYYDCMLEYCRREDFQYVEMDTDSAYMALSDEFENIIIPEKREQFYKNYGEWFPKPFCDKHHLEFIQTKMNEGEWEMRDCCLKQFKRDKRTPGLFKDEFKGDGIVALNSKTYYCWSKEKTKVSSKGLSKAQNELTKEKFLSVLKTGKPVSGNNKGFVLKEGSVYTYEQERTGLTYFYAKRKVCEDGVSTIAIDL